MCRVWAQITRFFAANRLVILISCCTSAYTTIAYSHGISANIGARTSSLGSNCSVFWRASIGGTDDFGFCTSEYTNIAYSQAKSVNIEAFEFGVKLLRLLTCVD